jgi:hypothetical protein
MKKKQENKKDAIKQHNDFIAFLEKRVQSKNFKENVSEEEYDKTVEKLKKARLKLKLGLIK